MLGGILILIITSQLALSMVNRIKKQHPVIDAVILKKIFYFHTFLSFVYYLYAYFNPSDSHAYYLKVSMNYRGDHWFGFYSTSTRFIEFLGYPFIKYFGFSYEAMMTLFSFFGFIGFVYFYVFFKENIKFKHTFYRYDLLTLTFFLPNLHFWSSSYGKGAIIFMGLGLFFYGVSKMQSRWMAILIGGLLVYHVRPHVMLVILISSAIGFVFTTKGISFPLRIAFLVCVVVSFYFIYSSVLTLVGIDQEELVTKGIDFSGRAEKLRTATSAVDISSYSLPMQLFTFLYRPLFVDAPGLLGLIISFENVFYMIITFKLLSLKGIRYLIMSNFLVKTCFFSFITVSIALAQISGNLGIAVRQKSQVMILFFFVIISFLDKKKLEAYKLAMFQRSRNIRLSSLKKEKTV